MKKYAVLEKTNYSQLVLPTGQLATTVEEKDKLLSLSQSSCACICKQSPAFIEEVLATVPSHLAVMLLTEAVFSIESAAVSTLIANWPLPNLCFRDVVKPSVRSLFDEEMGLDLIVFRGVTSRTSRCRMMYIDLRGFTLNWTFTRLIIQMWPLLSLKKSQRNVKRLTHLVLKEAGISRDNRLAKEIIPRLINDLITHEMMSHPSFGIHMSRGEKLVVLLDKLEFTSQNTFFMDYLITHCLRSLTAVQIRPTNIMIKSELSVGDEVLDAVAPFIVFRGQDKQCLEGICLENLEDNLFFITNESLHKFKNVSSLGLMNCNISLQEGRTRLRTYARRQVASLLGCYPHLNRLDLSQNSFVGCLPELLDNLQCQLEFISLRECDLSNCDIEYLVVSKHAQSLKELNVSKVCGLFPDDEFAVSTSVLLCCVTKLTNLHILNLSQNQITDSKLEMFTRDLATSFPNLQILYASENIVSSEPVLQLIRACAHISTMKYLSVPYSHNLLDALNEMHQGHQAFRQQIHDVLLQCHRNDIHVDVAGLAYAIFANL